VSGFPGRVERIDPILCVADLTRALTFYSEVLGFRAAPWRTSDFTAVSHGEGTIYLAERIQGRPGAWVWIGVDDVRPLHDHLQRMGVRIRMPPTNFPWALERQVEDPDGNVLRFGSDPR
jgi:predicted enzyme related to lactoylglutathione lyase